MEETLFVFILAALIFAGAVILKSWLRSAPKKDFFGIVIKVFDGDTVLVQSGFAQDKVRLAGEDAPEHDQRSGLESQRFLMNLILGKRVFVKVIDTDGYGSPVLLQNNIGLPGQFRAVEAVAESCLVQRFAQKYLWLCVL